MTDFFAGLTAVLVSLILNTFIYLQIRRRLPGEEGMFLSRVYVSTLLLRHLGALFLNANSADSQFARAFWGDSAAYDFGGYFIAQAWAGEGTFLLNSSRSVSGYGFHYFVATIYYIFGRNQLLVQFINATIGALTVPVVYSIAKTLFDARTARWPALFMAFFPQMIFWSCGMYKDTSIVLCIALAMYALLALRTRFSMPLVFLYVLTCVALISLRFYVFYVVAFATLSTFLFTQRRDVLGGLFAQAMLVLALGAGIYFGVRGETLEQQRALLDLEQVEVARRGQSFGGQTTYLAEADVSTAGGALRVLPLGVIYLLFAPFPWAVTGLRQFLTVPETVVWYGLMPAFLRGMRFTLGNRFRAALPIIAFTVTLTIAYAVFQSNVGTAYRQRNQITMFFFVFMGAGLEQRRRQRDLRRQRAVGPSQPAIARPA